MLQAILVGRAQRQIPIDADEVHCKHVLCDNLNERYISILAVSTRLEERIESSLVAMKGVVEADARLTSLEIDIFEPFDDRRFPYNTYSVAVHVAARENISERSITFRAENDQARVAL